VLGCAIQRIEPTALPPAAQSHDDCLVFYAVASDPELENFQSMLGSLIQPGASRLQARSVHLLGEPGLKIPEPLCRSGLFGHFVLRNYGDPSAAGEHYGRIIRQAESSGGNREPVESFQLLIELRHSNEKQQAVAEVEKLLRAEGFRERMIPTILTAVDELLMNAIYDARPAAGGEQAYVRIPRSSPIPLDGPERVRLGVQATPEHVAIRVVDSFGSLKSGNILGHVLQHYREQQYVVDDSRSGAGLGLSTTFQMGGSLLYVCEPGVRTEATVLFKKATSVREFREQFRFVSVLDD
jgi:hypothetical protein